MPAVDPIQKGNLDFDHQQRERLTEWRRQREKIAETSRQERQKQAEAERQDRLRRIERARIDRAVDEAEARSQETAAAKAARLINARTKLANRAELDALAARIAKTRRRAGQRRAAGIAGFVLAPIVALVVYLFAAAPPLYQAETRFALRATDGQMSPEMAIDMIRAPAAIAFVDRSFGQKPYRIFTARDPLRRQMLHSLLQVPDQTLFNHYVDVRTRRSDGSIVLQTRAPDQASATALSRALLTHLDSGLRAMAQQPAGPSPLLVYQPTTVADQAQVPDRLTWLGLGILIILAANILLGAAISAFRRHA